MGKSKEGVDDSLVGSLALEGVPGVVPVAQSASIPADIGVSMFQKRSISYLAGDARFVGAVDDDLVVRPERGVGPIDGGIVLRSRDVRCSEGELVQRHHKPKVVSAVQLGLQVVSADGSDLVTHDVEGSDAYYRRVRRGPPDRGSTCARCLDLCVRRGC